MNMIGEVAAGLLLARLIIGLGLASHGAQKLFGWFGGHGLRGTGQALDGLGFRPGIFFAVSAGLGEVGGGLLTALGLLGAIGPALIVMVMLVAVLAVHLKNGFSTANNGWELCGLYIAGALALAFGGFGAYSLDGALGLTMLSTPQLGWLLVGAAVVLAVLNLAVRRPVQQPVGQV